VLAERLQPRRFDNCVTCSVSSDADEGLLSDADSSDRRRGAIGAPLRSTIGRRDRREIDGASNRIIDEADCPCG
jgi:hypothetical protein